MRRLWDSSAVRRLRGAVKRRSPDDWNASRKLRLAQWRRSHDLGTWFWRVIGLIGLIASLGTPLHPEVRLTESAATGLLGWHLWVLGLFSGMVVFRIPHVEISPLANTPLGLVAVYRHVLGNLQRRALIQLGFGWMATLAAGVWLLFWHGQTDIGGAWLRLFTGSIFIYAMSASWALIPRLAPWVGWARLGGMMGLLFGIVWIWQLMCLDKERLRPREELGQAFALLPQSGVCRWISGGEMSGPCLICGLAGIAILGAAWCQIYRDRSEELGSDETVDEPMLTAEFVAAAAIRAWRKRLRDNEPEDEFGGENDEERADPPSLLFHPDAPASHAAPVSSEFLRIMGKEVRRVLDLPDAEGPAGKYVAYRGWKFQALGKTLRWALLWGCLGPLLLLAALLCREHHGPAWLLPGLDIGMALTLSCLVTFPVSPGFGLPAFHPVFAGSEIVPAWRTLPVPLRTHYQAFVAWSQRTHRRRGLFCAVGFAAAVVTAHLALALLLATNLAPQQCPSFGRLWSGPLSLTQLGVGLLMAMGVIRAFRIQPFASGINAHFRGRGWWKGVYSIALLGTFAAAGCVGSAGGWVIAGIGRPGTGIAPEHWPWIGSLILLAELISALATRIFLRYAAKGRGE